MLNINKKLFSSMSNIQVYYHFELDFQKVEMCQHFPDNHVDSIQLNPLQPHRMVD